MKQIAQLAVVASVWLSVATARAQSAPSCSFDEPTATLTITVNGIAASITRTVSGQIEVNGVACTGATTTTTDTILINGGTRVDDVTVTGSYTPGLTAEGAGGSEIEMTFSLGAANDKLRIDFTEGPDIIPFTAGGIDVGNDGDEDITTAGGTDRLRIYALGGDDLIDASAYVGSGSVLYLYGGNGFDTIEGSAQTDYLYGQRDSDSLYGGDSLDRLYGGQGDDSYYGDGGNDTFYQDATIDGNDTFEGGDGVDTVSYEKRVNAVSVSIGNGLADDGEAGELDSADATTENVIGGAGDDLLVGSAAANRLTGNDGDDTLSGLGGDDQLYGGPGADRLYGGPAADELFGDAGADRLHGQGGTDRMYGGLGADELTGGTGVDNYFGEGGNDVFFNNDGAADTVDCGLGAQDDPEPDPLDTFDSCEL